MGERCLNITFHGIGEPRRRLVPSELEIWVSSERFSFILDAVTGRSDVRLSFDDGNASDVRIALPALRRRDLEATFFISAGNLATPGYLDEEDVGALAAAGMTIGCHGMRHRPWRNLGDEELREELLLSRRRLEEIVGRPVSQAACPFGAYDRRVLCWLRRYDYERVFTSDRGCARSNRWLQPRNSVRREEGPDREGGSDLLEQIESLERPLRRALGRRAWRAVKRWR